MSLPHPEELRHYASRFSLTETESEERAHLILTALGVAPPRVPTVLGVLVANDFLDEVDGGYRQRPPKPPEDLTPRARPMPRPPLNAAERNRLLDAYAETFNAVAVTRDAAFRTLRGMGVPPSQCQSELDELVLTGRLVLQDDGRVFRRSRREPEPPPTARDENPLYSGFRAAQNQWAREDLPAFLDAWAADARQRGVIS